LCAFFPSASEKRQGHKPLLVATVAFLALESAAIAGSMVVSRSVVWWGGYCWGPRMLTELVPPLIVLMAFGVSVIERPWTRRAFAALVLYSFLIQALGVFFYPHGHWDAGPPSVDAVPARVWDWRDNPIARTINGGFYWEPYAIVAAAIEGGIPAATLRMGELKVNPYEEAKPGKRPREGRGLP
jgi:hypothetical protein